MSVANSHRPYCTRFPKLILTVEKTSIVCLHVRISHHPLFPLTFNLYQTKQQIKVQEISDGMTKPVEKPIPKPLPPTVSLSTELPPPKTVTPPSTQVESDRTSTDDSHSTVISPVPSTSSSIATTTTTMTTQPTPRLRSCSSSTSSMSGSTSGYGSESSSSGPHPKRMKVFNRHPSGSSYATSYSSSMNTANTYRPRLDLEI